MFNPFRKKREPEIEFLVFGPEQNVQFRSSEELGAGEQVFSAPVAGQTLKARINVQYFQDGVYSGLFQGPEEAIPFLAQLFAPVEPEAPPPDNRRATRVQRGLRVVSPDLPGFQAMSSDISTTGLKLQSADTLPPGTVIQMRLELDDARLSGLEVEAEIRWSRARDDKRGYFMGVMFLNLSSHQAAILRDFVNDLQNVECGVIKEYEFFD